MEQRMGEEQEKMGEEAEDVGGTEEIGTEEEWGMRDFSKEKKKNTINFST